MKTLADRMTHEWVPALAALAPDAGAYMNEVIFPVGRFAAFPY